MNLNAQNFLIIVLTIIFSTLHNVNGQQQIEQQNIGIPDMISPSTIDASSSGSSSQFISQQNIGIPDGPSANDISQPISSPSSSSSASSSQFISQQNIGIPDGPSVSDMNQPSSMPSISSYGSSSQFISQKNIGIPDIPSTGGAYQPISSNSLMRGGISLQRNPVVMMTSIPTMSTSSYGSASGFVPQLNIGVPGTIKAPSVMVMTGGRSGSGATGPIPLAVNSRHTVEYVDMPSMMTRNYVSSSLSGPSMIPSGSKGTAVRGQSTGGSYASQQNIGIPGNYGNRQVITLPVHSRHTVEYVDVPSTSNYKPITVQVPPARLAANINFHSGSSIKVTQMHESSPGSYQETSSVDEPIRLSHTVRRPIMQELRETIMPYRKVVQEIQPVQQEIRTVVAVARNPGTGGSMRAVSGVGGTGGSKSFASAGYGNYGGSMMPLMISPPSGMFGRPMISPESMMMTYGSSMGYGGMITNPQGYSGGSSYRAGAAKTKPYSMTGGNVGISTSSAVDSSSNQASAPSLISPSPKSTNTGASLVGSQQRNNGGQKGRRFYDGSYRIGQQKI